jgi:sec-independent protein translocase protein TatA
MGAIGGPELLIVVAIAVVLFGGSRIAELGKGLGKGISNFKAGLRDEVEEEPAAQNEE